MTPTSRRDFLKYAGAAALTFPGLGRTADSAGLEKLRPNVLFIILEDWGPFLHCYGEKEMFTPHLDQLAAEGRRYTNCFTSAPVCSPGRSSLMTGMSQYTTLSHQHRTQQKPALPPGVKTVPDLFRDAGYFTALGCGYSPKIDLNYAFDPAVSYLGKDWNARQPGQPFFAHLTLMGTHRPWKADASHPIDPAQVTLPPWYPDTPLTRKDWALALESAQVSDRLMGEIVERLKKEKLYDNTAIIVTSDHGVGLPRAKQFLYDDGLRIPLIIRWPARAQAGRAAARHPVRQLRRKLRRRWSRRGGGRRGGGRRQGLFRVAALHRRSWGGLVRAAAAGPWAQRKRVAARRPAIRPPRQRVPLPLHHQQVVLLLADDRPRPHYAQPRNGLARREALRPHHVQGDERARASQPSVAVHRHNSRGGVDDLQEVDDDVRGRYCAVVVVKVVVVQARRGEDAAVILDIVEPHHRGNADFAKDVCVVAGTEVANVVDVHEVTASGDVPGPLEGDELARDYFMQVAIRRVVIINVLFQVDFTPHFRVGNAWQGQPAHPQCSQDCAPTVH